jgi:photosystem II stability/assembly factor-like uncharacterized protein
VKTNYTKVAYCTILLFLFNITIFSQDNWTWLNPKPMGSSVESCGLFTGTNTLVAVGDKGLIIRSTNFGSTWEVVHTSTSNKLVSVSIVSSTIAYVSGESKTLLKTVDAGLSWNPTTDDPSMTGTYNQIHFVDDLNGFLRQTDKVFFTSDGGNTWANCGISLGLESISTLTAVSSTEIMFGTSLGKLYYAQSPLWSPINKHTFDPAYQVSAISRNGINWIASALEGLAYSSNNGVSWSDVVGEPVLSYWGLAFISETDAVAFTSSEEIIKSADYGHTWSNAISSGTSSLLSAASDLNGKALIIGTVNTQYYKAGSEIEWTKSSSNVTTRQLNSVYSFGNKIWAAGNNLTLLRSTDNGQNFESIPPAVSTLNIYDFKAVDQNNLYFTTSGSPGTIYRSTNAGALWTSQTLPSSILRSVAFFTDPTKGVVVGGTSSSITRVYFTTNSGTDWSAAAGLPLNTSFYSACTVPNETIAYASGQSGRVIKTIDGGVNWSSCNTAATGILYSVHFISKDVGWVAGAGGYIAKTTDGGGSWVQQGQPLLDTTTIYSVKFYDANYGIASGVGYIFKTTNGGATWERSLKLLNSQFQGAFILDQTTTIAVGTSGNIIKSSNAPLPVELVSFTASVRNNLVNLNWETATEVDNYGFEIERKDKNSTWTKIGFIEGHSTSNSPKYYSFSDNPTGSSKYSYRLKQIDNDGKFEYSGIVEVDLSGMLPKDIEIKNFPNPFNPETNINIKLPETAETTVELYNSTGEKIFTIYKGKLDVGTTLSLKVDGSNLPSGVYLINVSAGKYRKTHKILLMK